MTTLDNLLEQRITQVRKHVTIFEVLRAMGLDYEEATQQIKCPFHDDHSPSARVYADQNKVYCFTEHRSWDVIDAAQTLQACSLPDAVAWLEQEFAVPGVTLTLQGTIRTQLTSRVVPSVGQSAELVERTLKGRKAALGYATYTKLLAGLDLTVWEFSAHKITQAKFTERMGQLLQLAR